MCHLQFIHRGSYGRKEGFVNLLVRKIIDDYMYPVDLENNRDRVNIQYMWPKVLLHH